MDVNFPFAPLIGITRSEVAFVFLTLNRCQPCSVSYPNGDIKLCSGGNCITFKSMIAKSKWANGCLDNAFQVSVSNCNAGLHYETLLNFRWQPVSLSMFLKMIAHWLDVPATIDELVDAENDCHLIQRHDTPYLLDSKPTSLGYSATKAH